MAVSRCFNCGNTSFEVVEKQPVHSAYRLMFVQCSYCGCVVGTVDYFNMSNQYEKLKRELEKFNDNNRMSADRIIHNQNILNEKLDEILKKIK